MTSSQTIQTNGLHGLNDDIVGIRRDVTIRDNKQQTKEDSGTQPMEAGRLSFAICLKEIHSKCLERCTKSKRKEVQKKVQFFLDIDPEYFFEQVSKLLFWVL